MIAQTVAELLADHVRLTVEGIDRLYLNVYVPRLQCASGAVSFFRDHRRQPLASTALMSPMSRRFVAELDRFVARHRLPPHLHVPDASLGFPLCCFAKASAKTM